MLAWADRSAHPTFGIGVLCQKPAGTHPNRPASTAPYLPIGSSWRRDPRWLLRWKLWYAFHAGRGREALSWRAPFRILWAMGKSLWNGRS